MENDPPQGRKGKKHYKELELSSVFSKNSDFVIGCGLGAQIDPKECLFIDQQNPAQTNRIMNKCFSFIQVLKNMGSVREFMCSKQQFTDCTPFLNQLVLTLKNSCQPNEIQEGTRLANLVESLKLDETVFFQEIIEKIVREIQESNQNQTHEKLLKELTPWSIWFKDNNNFSDQVLSSMSNE
ncbi:hypothetical protein FGO68_gene10266 [Halteria grandinella]|uniref:Uncharacterized protein n=1 Tax=Halteria grandinella TaxID=5974 RepID=A0A8J8P234_HALGN|nr:hypothetical protein FGO68_gene10266 [Halteria grandinella]